MIKIETSRLPGYGWMNLFFMQKCHSWSFMIVLLIQVSYMTDLSARNRTSAGHEMPVLRWTANQDPMNLRYEFIKNLDTAVIYFANPDQGTFSHHGHLEFVNDILYAVWDSHIRDENGSGQHCVFRYSLDHGNTWSEINELFPSLDKNVPESVAYFGTRHLTFNGFAFVDNVLYALADVGEWKGSSNEDRSRINHGRICRSLDENGSVGKIFWLDDNSHETAKGFPSFPAGEKELVEKIGAYFLRPGKEIQFDYISRHPVSDDNHEMNDPVPSWELKDGTLVRMYRDNGRRDSGTAEEQEETKSRRNYVSFSSDSGRSWTIPVRTSFPDAGARSCAGILPDGSVYVINNLLPLSSKKGGRTLLAISIAKDGLTFDRMLVIHFLSPPRRFEGRGKSPGYHYPHSAVVGEDIWVICGVNKEDILLTRIPVSQLYK